MKVGTPLGQGFDDFTSKSVELFSHMEDFHPVHRHQNLIHPYPYDRYLWSESKAGTLRVKDVYAFYLGQHGKLDMSLSTREFWHKLWASNISPKWKFFTRRLLNRALATNRNLLKRNIPVQASCHLCNMHMESESHLFRDCAISARVWACSSLGIRICSTPSTHNGSKTS